MVAREDQRVWTPEHGQRQVPLTFCYSTEGPQHLELLEGVEGTPWWSGDLANLHHAGVYADVPALTEDLVSRGWTLVCSQVSPDDGYGSFSYVRSPDRLPAGAGGRGERGADEPLVRGRQPVLTASAAFRPRVASSAGEGTADPVPYGAGFGTKVPADRRATFFRVTTHLNVTRGGAACGPGCTR